MIRASALLLALCAAGCSVGEVGYSSEVQVSSDKLASSAEQWLVDHGYQTKSVTCAGNLSGKVGATQKCLMTALDSSTRGVTATVTKVEGSAIDYDLRIDK